MKIDPNLPGTPKPDANVPAASAPASARPNREWLYMLGLFGGFALLYFLTAQPIGQGSAASRSLFALVTGLATERSPYLDHFLTNPGGNFLSSPAEALNTAFLAGHYYYDSAPGSAILTVPFYQFGRLFGPDGAAAFSLALVALLGAATPVLVYAACRRLGSARRSTFYAVFTLGLASAVWREAGIFGPGVFTLFLLALALWLALPPLPREVGDGTFKLTGWRGLALGLVLGLAVAVDYPNLVWTPLFAGYLLWGKRLSFKSALTLVAGWLGGLLVLAAYNWLAFGRPWTFSYGFLLNDAQSQSLTGQFLGGFDLKNLPGVFFSPDRGLFGPFVLLFGLWGLIALFGQRGKRKETVLFLALIVVSVALALVRRPLGNGYMRVDFALAALPPMAIGIAVWHERFMFLTRLEQTWLPALATGGVGLYYLLAPPGPFANFGAILYLLPIVVLIGLGLALWIFTPRVGGPLKAVALTALLVVIGLVFTALSSPARPALAGSSLNNLLYNGQLECSGTKYVGWYVLDVPAGCTLSGPIKLDTGRSLKPYLVPAQGGKVYHLQFRSTGAVTLDWVWTDEGHRPLAPTANTFVQSWRQEWAGGDFSDNRAAPPGAAYLQLVFTPGASIQLSNFALADDSVRVEPMPNYSKAALAFSFDWESAMGGLIHSRGGVPVPGESEGGGMTITDQDINVAVTDAIKRGNAMRTGADYLLSIFTRFDVKGTFYANGYNLLDGNPKHDNFVGNPTYKWANQQNGWGSNYWLTHPWYGQDPYGTDKTDPAWYFGDQTDKLNAAGQDIQSHTFGHLYVRGTTVQEFADDMDAFKKYAALKKLPPMKSFAFPWKSSNSLTTDWYKVLAQRGFNSVTRLYDQDQMVRNLDKGNLQFDNCRRTADNKVVFDNFAGPCNTYFYLSQVKGVTELSVLNDYQLESGNLSETTAYRVIEELLQRRGYGSIWTHPESIVEPSDQEAWARVVQYATQKRADGLWVDSVTNLVQFRKDAAQVEVRTEWQDGGKKARLTVTNHSEDTLDGVTLTLPAEIRQANGAAGSKAAQLLVPTLAKGQSLTIDVDF